MHDRFTSWIETPFMSTAIQPSVIEQLEARLHKLERLRQERKAWLKDLILPVEARYEALAKMRHARHAQTATNIVRFPIEKRLAENDAR